jgi:hypothetical protein
LSENRRIKAYWGSLWRFPSKKTFRSKEDGAREDECDRLALHACDLVQHLEILEEIGGVIGLCDGDLECVCPCKRADWLREERL